MGSGWCGALQRSIRALVLCFVLGRVICICVLAARHMQAVGTLPALLHWKLDMVGPGVFMSTLAREGLLMVYVMVC